MNNNQNPNSGKNTVKRKPRNVNVLLLEPTVSTGPTRESEKHLRVQISIYLMSLQTLEGYFADLMVISFCPEATETGTNTAKVKKKKKKRKLYFLRNELALKLPFFLA